jgi:SAM-dependent methyltransferase
MDLEKLRETRRRSFGGIASFYDRSRPSYPDAAVDWLLSDGVSRVVDLGAGTGKLTTLLIARGLDVTTVEPSEGMRDQLQAVLPDVAVLEGSGESLPLPDASVDAVLVAQAWHWVDVAKASVEVARVVRPGGYLGLVWNRRDKSVDWVRQLGRAATPDITSDDMDVRRPEVAAPFTRFEHFDVSWSHPLTPQGLVDLMASRSYVITATPAEHEEILANVKRLTEQHPDLAGKSEFAMPYVTYCTRAYVQ